MNLGHRVIAVLAVVGIGLPSSAYAASVTATLYGVPAGVQPGTNSLNLSFDCGAHWDNNAYVGQINWHNAIIAPGGLNSELSSILGPGDTFATYCIEGTQNVYFGALATWESGVVNLDAAPIPGGGMGDTKARYVSEFWNRNYASIGTNDELASAFQLGIWEIVNDGVGAIGSTDRFTTGTLRASGGTSSIFSTTNDWLNQLTGNYSGSSTIYALSSGTYQDQIFAVPGVGTPPSTPLPAAFPAGVALIGALGAARAFRRKLTA